ncbi:MAG: heparinase II/III family protein, partial [Armatimonadota bacterium]|nr:heparinase II/III family protein [Armatimonadota bacterium]
MAEWLRFDVVTLALMAAFLWTAGRGHAQAEEPDWFSVPDREAFLRLLDLDRPELAAVREALEAGDAAAAGAAYVQHFRTMQINSSLIRDWGDMARDPDFDTSRADALLEGHFWDGYSVWEVPETGFDWYDSPLSCCTRFPVLGTLRSAAHHTQDPKYVRFMVEHILGYMEAYPIEEFVGKSSTDGWTNHTTTAKPWYWCMIPGRLTELSQTVALLRSLPAVGDDELLAILQRMYEETGYLTTQIKPWVDRRHNGGGAMISAMAHSCAILRDFPAAQEWLAYDAELVAQYLDDAFYPDGMCVELTTAYSASVSVTQQRLAFMLREQEAIRARRDRLRNMVTAMVALSDPTGRLPSFGDLYAGDLAGYVHQPLVDWLGMAWVETIARGAAGPAPPFLVWPRPGDDQWCGYYTMRSDWSPKARYMAIDGGPWGTTHQHGDRLSFVITAWGAKFIIDPSGTRYASNEPDAFIGGQPSGFLHNTITVDGVDEFHSEGTVAETTEPLGNVWEHGTDYTLFVSDYSFRPVKPVTWERRVLFVDGSYWVLQDVLTGDQSEAEIEQNFQFEADIEIELQGTSTVATAPNGARLMLAPLDASLQPVVTVGDREPHTSYW